MKKLIYSLVSIVSTLALVFASTPITPVSAQLDMAHRLSGRIVLQTEEEGEAWYINPVDYKRYYLGRPRDAWNIMRALGLGATDVNLARVPINGTSWTIASDMIKYVNGRILIQVELNGEAWYVSPVNLQRYYMGRPADAFQLMRNLGLGITNSDLSQIEVGIVDIPDDDSSDSSDSSSDSDSNSGSTNSTNLQPSNLTYQGAFKLPSDFDWGARGIALYEENNKKYLFVTGHDQQVAEVGRVNIPTPVKASSWNNLNQEATIVDDLSDYGSSIVNSVNPGTVWASGLEYISKQGSQTSGKLYGSIDNWYAVIAESHPTIWFAETNGSNPRGPFHVGSPQDDNYHGNKAGDYLFQVPEWYANEYLGGRTLMIGKSRGASFGSQGPTLLAFDPWSSENPSGNLDALSVLRYRVNFDCASPNVTNKSICDFPNFTMCDKWEGGSFVQNSNKRAIMIYGEKGLGDNNYGIPPSGSCEESKGYYCDPKERQVLFYNVDQIGEIAKGERDPWSVVPYETWRPDEFFLGDSNGHTCGQAGDMTYDSESKKLYIVEKGCGDSNSAAVHVYKVN